MRVRGPVGVRIERGPLGARLTVRADPGGVYLGAALRGCHAGALVYAAGTGGATAADIAQVQAAAFREALASLRPSAVYLILGTNDYRRGVSPGSFAHDYRTVLRRVQEAAPGARKVVVSPSTPHPYAAVLRRIAAGAGARFVDLAPVAPASDARLWADALHPSGSGGQRVASVLVGAE